MNPDSPSSLAPLSDLPRRRVLTDWEEYARGVEEAFREPIIVDHMEAMAEVPGVFASVFGNLERTSPRSRG